MGKLIKTYNNMFVENGRHLTDKGSVHSYLETYEKEFDKNNFSILEVGIYQAGSLILWDRAYENCKVYGLDDTPPPPEVSVDYEMFICDSTNKTKVDYLLKDLKFDYIVDDGSHEPVDQVKTFINLKDKVNTEGKYIIEDVYDIEKVYKELVLIGYNPRVVDLRSIKNRYDDVLFIIDF